VKPALSLGARKRTDLSVRRRHRRCCKSVNPDSVTTP
jgi:hypothetical protein